MSDKKIAWLAAAVALSGPVAWAGDVQNIASDSMQVQQLLEEEKNAVNIYKAYFPDVSTGRKAAISFHHALLESNYDDGYLVLELNNDELDRLRSFGFKIKPATEFMAKRKELIEEIQSLSRARAMSGASDTNASIFSIPRYSCYETVEETFAAAAALAGSKPSLASWIDVGDSWQKKNARGGYDIRVLKLTNSATGGDKPKLFINSAIHAREYTTAPLVLEFARWLVNGYGTNADATWILDNHEVHLMLQTNPDGRKKAESGLSWRKNTNTAYCGANSNSRGADLNRNFTYSWNSTGGTGSSGSPCNETFRGPSPASEPEIQALEAYVRTLWPDLRGPNVNDPAPATTSGIHMDIHSYSELVLWPWGDRSTPAPNGTALQTLGRKFAYFNNYTPQQSIGLYATDGTSDSISYGELGVAAFTIELGTSFFQSCSTYNNTIKPKNLPALIYAAKVVRTPYITPAGPDVTLLELSNNAATTGVPKGTQVTLSATTTDTRFNNSNGTEPTQNIAQAEYYIDTPPWAAGATPIALAAKDGNFNAKTEDVTGTISTSSLSTGQHMVYVRSRDASGSWGAVTASFLKIN
ncbi:M14 family metallopeptidase [Chitinimonas sp. PSY-7]|uniref:M14 family zinc carboxypeptidase n=1 Tax=Chitinimonas sp. PSY-7 TaxID=3459088 RepID=UPI00403FD229